MRTLAVSAIALAEVVSACQSQQQIVDEMQADATHVAQRRGAFELNCPAATATVLSKEMIQKLLALIIEPLPAFDAATMGVRR